MMRILLGLTFASTAFALAPTNVEISTNGDGNINYFINDGSGPVVGDVEVDLSLEGFSFTLEPVNMNCDDPMWPSVPGVSVHQGCGMVTLSDGGTGLYVYTDTTPGNFRKKDILWIESDQGNTYRFKRRLTTCGPDAYTFITHREEIVLYDDSAPTQQEVGIGYGYVCFDLATWDLAGS